jgi:hypothetical protein
MNIINELILLEEIEFYSYNFPVKINELSKHLLYKNMNEDFIDNLNSIDLKEKLSNKMIT